MSSATPTGGRTARSEISRVSDDQLIATARDGGREALDELVRRHQSWIYSLALRMLWDARDAEDATQEILIRVVRNLSSFRGESAFRTWAYRIAANHLLSRRKGRVEEVISGFECYGRQLDRTPDDTAAAAESDPELRLTIEEAKIGCTTGMLLCLDREQRIIFILGEIFDVTDSVGAEVLDMTKENFRQKLARARQQLYSFMQGKCGLANPANPCRCARKTRAFIAAGIVDPKRLQFAGPAVSRAAQLAPGGARALDSWTQAGYTDVFRTQPLQDGPDLIAGLRALIRDRKLHDILDVTGRSP